MKILSVAGRAASVFAGMVAAEWQAAAAQFPWADGEQPLTDEPEFFPGYDVYATVPQSSAGSGVPISAVEPAEPPHAGSALPQPSVGHPKPLTSVELQTAAAGLETWLADLGLEDKDSYPRAWLKVIDRLREAAKTATQ